MYLCGQNKQKKCIMFDLEKENLGHSIENVLSGDSFPTEISLLTKNDLKQITRKNNWNFDWSVEYKNPYERRL